MTFSYPKNIIPVTCILLFYQGKVLVAQRSLEMDLPLLWEFPGGKVEKGETEEGCIVREIREELGIEIGVVERLEAFDHNYNDRKIIRLIPFLGYWVNGEISLLEHSQLTWLAQTQLSELEWAPADLPIVKQLERYWNNYHEKVLNFQNNH